MNRLSTDSERTTTSASSNDDGPSHRNKNNKPISLAALRRSNDPPEWLKRTVCCAKFECKDNSTDDEEKEKEKAVIAITCIPTDTNSQDANNRYLERASGTLTKQWAINAGLTVLDITPEKERSTTTTAQPFIYGRIDDDEDIQLVKELSRMDFGPGGPAPTVTPPMVPWGGPAPKSPPPHKKQSSMGEHPIPSSSSTGKHHLPPPPASPRRSGQAGGGGGGYRGRRPSGGGLVEKPSAPIPLTTAGLLPAGKTIRILRKGEKLVP